MRFQGHRRRRQEDDGYSNNKRSNCSNTHPLKSAILISRASRSEVRGVGHTPRAMPWAMPRAMPRVMPRAFFPYSFSEWTFQCPLHNQLSCNQLMLALLAHYANDSAIIVEMPVENWSAST